MLWWLLTFFTFSLLQGISAQSDASCLPFYNWTFNSEKKSPCDIASSLLAVCNNGSFPVDALPDSSHYLGPSLQNANACQCNTVTYSLMSACGACQGQIYLPQPHYFSWSVWSANCAMVYVDTYPEPIPSGVSVPGWAYLDVEANDDFDQTNAKNHANLTESTAIPSSTSSAAKTQTPLSTVKPSPLATTSSAASSPSNEASSPSPLSTTPRMQWEEELSERVARNGEQLPSPTVSENASLHTQGPYMRQVTGPAPQTPALPSTVYVSDVLDGWPRHIQFRFKCFRFCRFHANGTCARLNTNPAVLIPAPYMYRVGNTP
ncbi:hypothetical protein BDZ97DRAFT_1754280 [Flammula alnicola]|nr:hypothetical protein BDZ97DRAFT_1754280 [Flammula alnicola]